jgi:hypothetical protein
METSMSTGSRGRVLAYAAGIVVGVLWGVARPEAATINAASCSRDAVNAAIAAAVNGDTVLIPNGSCSWSSGISTTKQITVRAQNYTPTPMGATSRSVTITNNSSSPLFEFTTGNSFHVALIGIRFNEGSGLVNHLRVEGSGSKVALISDNYFEVRQRNGNSDEIAIIYWAAQGGILWNNRFVGVGSGPGGSVGPDGASIVIKNSPRVWNTPSTMGSKDTNGTINVYFEDSTFLNVGQCPDVDDHGRAVFRYNDIDGCSGVTHGFSSAWGGRHVEYYNNQFHVSTHERNIAGRYFWMRAGTGVFFNNTVAQENRGYGLPCQVSFIVEGGGSYPKPRQVGRGYENGDVSDPVYVWNQTGPGAYDVENMTTSMIQENRDYFLNKGPKPGYSPYAYPHPLRGGGGGTTPPAPQAPVNLRIIR